MSKRSRNARQAIILAGGKGTRLRPLTLTTPKPVVPMANRPLLTYQLEILRRAEIRKVMLSLSYRPEEVQAIMKSHCPSGLDLDYAVEEEPLGTGGAVRFASRGTEGMLVIFNGDIMIDLDLRAVIERHRRSGAKATIVLTRVDDPTVYGLVETSRKGRVRGFIEKPSWDEVRTDTVNAGVYVIEQELVRYLPDRPCSIEREFFPELVRLREPFYAYVHEGYWLDIGTSEKYLQAHRDLLDRSGRSYRGYRRRGANLWLAPGVTFGKRPQFHGAAMIGPGTTMGDFVSLSGSVVLGQGCRIGDHVSLEDCVIWDGVEIGEGARLRGSVLGKDTTVGAHAHLSGHIVLGERSAVSAFSRLTGAETAVSC